MCRSTVWRALGPSLALAALSASSIGTAQARSLGNGPPEGLTAADWSGIREVHEASRYTVFPADGREGAYEARSLGQAWSTRFDGRGFTTEPDARGWSWGLELERYGFVGRERDVESPVGVAAVGPRVAYVWDDVLEEWYVNDRRGLEHGYTVRGRPPDHLRTEGRERDPLTFTLKVRGDLVPEVEDDGRGVRFVDESGGAVLTYSGLTVLDADGRVLPARLELAGEGLSLTVDERGARYPLTIDPTAQQAYLKAQNTGRNDGFGTSVAVSGDTVVVGAWWEDSESTGVNGEGANNNVTNAGAAYVFVRSGSTWSRQAYLKASNTDYQDWFGTSVSVSGDTVVVGAPRESSNATGVNGNQADNGAPNAGAAYVFVRSGSTWSQQAYLKASNTGANDQFGESVSISGDTVVVGASKEASNATGVSGNQADNGATDAGAAYVFVRSGSTWSQQAYLKASNTDAQDQFGDSVSISGDTAVVGAWQEDSNATGVNGNQSNNSVVQAGAAYVFARSGTTWSQQAYLKASNTDWFDTFGFSVSVSGGTAVVGAISERSNAMGVNGNQADNSLAGAGAAYAFVRSGTTWTQLAYVKASNTDASDFFGHSVSVSGDTAVIGAPEEDSIAITVNGNQGNLASSFDAGAAYVFLLERPVAAALTPDRGPFRGGNTVTLLGEGLTPSTTVEFGGVPSPAVTFMSASELSVVVPGWPLPPRSIRGPVHHAAVFTTVDVSVAEGPWRSTLPDAYTYEMELRRR